MAVQVDWNAQLVIGLKKGDVKIVRTAIEKGADIEKPFYDTQFGNVFPLEFTIRKPNLDLAAVLLEHGAQIVRSKEHGRGRIDFRNIETTNAIFELLNTTQHNRVFKAELTSDETATRRPGLSG